MKKITLFFVTVIMSATLASAQTTAPQTAESLLKKLEKSDKDIENPKKNVKYITWLKRADLFLDMVQFNTKALWQGMPQSGAINSAEVMLGKPKEITSLENKEDWVYERVTLKFVDKKLDSWDETKPLIADGLDKANEAYLKAWELDEKGKLKSNKIFSQNISVVRTMFASRGVEYYGEAQETENPDTYRKAVLQLEKALKLDEFPKLEADTVFNRGLVVYYSAYIAQSGKHYDIAEKYYKLCLEKEYEGDKAYIGLASLYNLLEQPEKELEILQEGFQKYPDSNEILVYFINYYLSKGMSEKALVKLEKGIKENPNNPTYYHAMGTLYDTMMQDTTDKYNDEQKEEYLDLAIDSYNKAVELKADYFDALYNIAAIYYNKGASTFNKAINIPQNQQKKYDAEMAKVMDYYKQALPYFEKAHEIQLRDRNTLLSLSTIYLKLQMYDKQKEMKEMIDNLPEE